MNRCVEIVPTAYPKSATTIGTRIQQRCNMANVLTYEMCEKIFDTAIRPMIRSAAESGILNRFDGSMVVIRPNGLEIDGDDRAQQSVQAFGGNLTKSIPNIKDALWVGFVQQPDPTYTKNAFAKAHMCQRTGMRSSLARYDSSFSYHSGDCVWGGGIIEDGLVVAFSGVQEYFDEAISRSMIAFLRGACQEPARKTLNVNFDEGWLE